MKTRLTVVMRDGSKKEMEWESNTVKAEVCKDWLLIMKLSSHQELAGFSRKLVWYWRLEEVGGEGKNV